MKSFLRKTPEHHFEVVYRGLAVPFTQYPDAVFFQKTVDQTIKDHGTEAVLEQLRELVEGL